MSRTGAKQIYYDALLFAVSLSLIRLQARYFDLNPHEEDSW